jgi:hypothetical protein
MRAMSPLALLILLAAAGCGSGPGYAPVSGVVTLDGKPYGEAVVSFQPIATEGNPNPGRGSSGETDATGRFVLKTDDLKEGAVVGKHRVRIMTRGNDVVTGFDPATGSPDSTPVAPRGKIDPIPLEWNAYSDKEFEVPAGGTDKANFDIISKK